MRSTCLSVFSAIASWRPGLVVAPDAMMAVFQSTKPVVLLKDLTVTWGCSVEREFHQSSGNLAWYCLDVWPLAGSTCRLLVGHLLRDPLISSQLMRPGSLSVRRSHDRGTYTRFGPHPFASPGDSPASTPFKLFDAPRPCPLQELRPRLVGECAPAGLTAGTVVARVLRVDDPLNRGPHTGHD